MPIDLTGLFEPENETPVPRPGPPAKVQTRAESMPFLDAMTIGNKLIPEDRLAAARALFGPKAIIEPDTEGRGGIAIRTPEGKSHYIEEPTWDPSEPNFWKKENAAQLVEPIALRGMSAATGAELGATASIPSLGTATIPMAALGALGGLFMGPSVQNLAASFEPGGSSAGPLDLIEEGAKDAAMGTVAAKVIAPAFRNVLFPSGRAASTIGQAYKALKPSSEGASNVAENLRNARAFNMTEDALPPAQVLADASHKAPSVLSKMLRNSQTARGLEEAGTRNIATAAENIRASNVRPELEAAMQRESAIANAHPEISRLIQERDVALSKGDVELVKELNNKLNDYAHPFIPDVEGAVSAAREGMERGAKNYGEWQKHWQAKQNAIDEFNNANTVLDVNHGGASTTAETNAGAKVNPGEIQLQPSDFSVEANKTKLIKPKGTVPEYTRNPADIESNVREIRQGLESQKNEALKKARAARAGQSYSSGYEKVLNGPNETLAIRAEQAKHTPLAPALRSRIAQKSTPGKFNNNIVDALRADGSDEAKQLLAIDEFSKKMFQNMQSIQNVPQPGVLGKMFGRGGRIALAVATKGTSEGALFAKRFFSNDRALRKVVENPELRAQLYDLITHGKTPEEVGKGLISGALGGIHHDSNSEGK